MKADDSDRIVLPVAPAAPSIHRDSTTAPTMVLRPIMRRVPALKTWRQLEDAARACGVLLVRTARGVEIKRSEVLRPIVTITTENSDCEAADRVVRAALGSALEELAHLRQERWALERARASRAELTVRRWRDSGSSTWFWSDDRSDLGNVFLHDGRYVATTARGSATFASLADAKDFVEEHSS